MIIKRLKNNSGSDRQLFTRMVSDQGYYNLPFRLWVEALDDDELLADIVTGDIVVNDGTVDLDSIQGTRLMFQFQPHVTETTLNAIIPYTFSRDGKAKNRWLDYSNKNISSNATHVIVPFKSKLVSITYSNTNNGTDTDIELWKTIEDSPYSENKLLEWSIRDSRGARKSDFVDKIINAGDRLGIYMDDEGTDPTDVVVVIYLQVIEDNDTDIKKDWSGNW